VPDRPPDLVHGVPPIAISNTTTEVNKTGSWKYIRPQYRDAVAPCNAGCPVGIDIEGYMNLVREERIDEAVDLLVTENPLPATTGRVCHHPCEAACNRLTFDGAVAIHAVERWLGDLARERPLPAALPRTHREQVAVVGSGPAGLACAYFLVRLGYGVTMYEEAPEPGGVLRYGIPEYRLPKDVLADEIARIEALGVDLRCGVHVGSDVPWAELAQFDAVFAAIGVHESRPLGIPGEDDGGVRSGLDFLREVNEGGRPDVGERVVVVGGGNTAIDAARTALRLGAAVTILYRRTRDEMPAIAEEIAAAEREGIEFRFLAAPVGLQREGEKLTGVECREMELGEPDASGRPRPVPVAGSEFTVPVDLVLTAIGEAPRFGEFPLDVAHDDWVVDADETGGTSRVRFFAGGDIIDQPHTVADAIGSGKRAAVGIDLALRLAAGEALEGVDHATLRFGADGNFSMNRWRNDDPIHRINPVNEVVAFTDLNTDYFAPAGTHPDVHRSPADARSGFVEANQGLSPAAARAEALRCFNCGVCNQCEVCLIFCPDVAISRRADGLGFDIAYDYCKGCGLCAAECPRGAMVMTREGL
jgi:NADPH-dependent glutamate synthase beta subunit-like oxidoreductase